MNAPRETQSSESGFSLIDLLVVVALVATVSAIGIPSFLAAVDQYKLGQDVRLVERELQFARLKAVATQNPMRIRFNCPVAGSLRAVELIGTPGTPDAADSATNRCDETAYPYSPTGADKSRLTRPNNDGPVRRLKSDVAFTAVTDLEFWPDGTVHTPCTGPCGTPPQIGTVTISIKRKTTTKNITVNNLGKIQMDR
jgi:type II secretory pathway pseudopilin PulG